MNTHEMLVKLIQEAVDGCAEYWAARIADHLIENGVTVKEKKKPLTLEAAIEAKYVYIEQREIGCPEFVKLYRHSLYKNSVQVFMIGCLYPWNFFIECYGKEWRCWAEKPTEKERMDAEWD